VYSVLLFLFVCFLLVSPTSLLFIDYKLGGMAKPLISTDDSVVAKIFTALGKDNDESAFRLFREASIDLITGTQSPRPKAFVDSGEWDLKEKWQIRLIGDGNCSGRIGSTASTPVGVDRFCGKECFSIATHQKSQLIITPGFWYIYTVRTTGGFFSEPNLASAKLGGPLSRLFEALSQDSRRNDFVGLTLGRWKFLFGLWNEERMKHGLPTEKPLPLPEKISLVASLEEPVPDKSLKKPLLKDPSIVSIKSLVKEQGAVPTLTKMPLMGPIESPIGNLEAVSATNSSPYDPIKFPRSDSIKPSIKL
jgi:hypothetical protein